MSGNRRAQVHFDANLGGSRNWRRDDRDDVRRGNRRKSSQSILAEALYRSKYGDDDDDFVGIDGDDEDVGFEDMKILRKKKGIKAISSGKVLNTSRKRYRRWKRHDKRVLKDMITPSLNEMLMDGDIKKRKAKKVRKQFVKRVLSCFYAKEKKKD